MAPTTVRLPRSVSDRIAKELRKRGYSSLAAFIRIAVQNELDGRDAEERLTSTMERFSRELRRLDTAHQAEFAPSRCIGPCRFALPPRTADGDSRPGPD